MSIERSDPSQPSRPRKALQVLCVALAFSAGLPAQRTDPLQHQSWGIEEGLPQNSVHAIAQTPDGFLWVATEDGLARFDGVQFKVYTREDLGGTVTADLCCLTVDAAGILWVGSSFGMAALDHGHPLPLPPTAPFARTPIRHLFTENGHTIAITDFGSFQLHAHGKAEAISTPPETTPAPVLRDRNGDTWFGTAGGLTQLVRGTRRAVAIPSLTQQPVLSLLQDTSGDLWVGTETTGLHRLRRSAFHTLAGSEGTPATSVAWSFRGLLLGTRAGELKLIPSTGEPRVLARFPAGITTLAVTSGAAWVGTTDGLYRVADNAPPTRFTSADGLPDEYIRSLAAGSNGDVWAGTSHGLAHLSGAGIEVFTAKNGLGGDLIGALLPAPGHPAGVWVATEAGLALLEGSRISQTIDLAGSVIAGVTYDQQGTLWFATQDGRLWRSGADRPHLVLQLPSASARHSIQSLFVDQRDTLWVVLRDGILSASVPYLRTCDPQSCGLLTAIVASWGVADGMPSAESLPGGFGPPAENGRGEVLFATRAGVAVAASEEAARPLQVPAVIERTTLEDRTLDSEHLQSIPYGKTRLTFDYEGIAIGAPGRVRYRVRLHGFDSNWIETGVHRTATYTALPPGSYRFGVQATLNGQPWPASSASLSFSITPPLYRRWWFLASGILVAFGLVLFAYRLRLSAEHRRFALIMAERNRLAREVHDTLAQDLISTGIQLDVVILSLDRQPRERTMESLRILRRRVAQALTEARESIGELRDPTIRLDLTSRLHRMAERKSTAPLPVFLGVSGTIRDLKPGVEKELLRIVGEALENALRHAHATSVSVQLHSTADALTIAVVDTGQGFILADAESMNGHYGLRGMRERAEAIGATLAIASATGNGTSVQITVSYSRRGG